MVDVPSPTIEGVRIKVASSGICGSDLHLLVWNLPATFGHEFAATLPDGRPVAIEAGPYGIRVNTIAPGSTPTNFNAQGRKDDSGNVDPSKLQVYLDRNSEMSPIGRVGEAIDQAHLIHFLASDASKFATGATFRANGGVGLVW